MTCKSICVKYEATGSILGGRYYTGQSRCQVCEIWVRWDGVWCPCCGQRLRKKPRNSTFKTTLRVRQGSKLN